jgi:hypothetical protein
LPDGTPLTVALTNGRVTTAELMYTKIPARRPRRAAERYPVISFASQW